MKEDCLYFEGNPKESFHFHGERIHWNPSQEQETTIKVPLQHEPTIHYHTKTTCPHCNVMYCVRCDEVISVPVSLNKPTPITIKTKEWSQKQLVFMTRIVEAAVIGVIVSFIISIFKFK